LENIMDDYRGTIWSVKAADIYIDLLSDADIVNGSSKWNDQLYEDLGLDYYGDQKKFKRIRRYALKKADKTIRTYRSKCSGEESDKLADRAVLNHIKMMPYLEPTDSYYSYNYYYGSKKYGKLTGYIDNILKKDMTPDMRSSLEYYKSDIIYEYYPVDDDLYYESGGEKSEWLRRQRLKKVIENLHRVADKYPDNVGGLYSRIALAHLDVFYFDDPDEGVAGFSSIADDIDNKSHASYIRELVGDMKRPGLAILGISSNPYLEPEAVIEVASKRYEKIDLNIYPVTDEDFFELPATLRAVDLYLNDGRKVEIDYGNEDVDVAEMDPLKESIARVEPKPTSELPGVGEPVKSVSAVPENYDNLKMSVTDIAVDDLVPGLYIAEAAADGNIARAYFLHSKVSLFYTGNNDEFFFQLIDVENGEPMPINEIVVYEVYREFVETDEGREIPITRVEQIEPDLIPTGPGYTINLHGVRPESTLLLTVLSNYGPAFAEIEVKQFEDVEDYHEIGIVYTDRPMYHPGNSVAFKTILREVDFDNKVLRPAEGCRVGLKAISPHKEEIWKGEGITDEYGALWGSFKVPVGASLGDYNLYCEWPIAERTELKAKGEAVSEGSSEVETADEEARTAIEELEAAIAEAEETSGRSDYEELVTGWGKTRDEDEIVPLYSARCSFEIEEYEKPEYEINLASEKPMYYSGDKVRIVVEGSYFFGSPMADARVEYKIYRSGRTDRKYDREYGYWDEYEWEELKKEGTGRTDKNGRYTIEFKSAWAGKYDNHYRVEAKITDSSNHVVEGEIDVETKVVDTTVWLDTDQYEYHWYDDIRMEISVFDWLNQPRSIPVDIAVYGCNKYDYDEKQKHKISEKTVVTEENGEISYLFKLDAPQVKDGLLIVASALDRMGTEVEEKRIVWLVSEDEEPYKWMPEVSVEYDGEEPSPGDTITVRIESKYTDVKAEVLVYGDGFVELDNVALTANPEGGSYADYRIKIKDEYAPEMVVKAVVAEEGNHHDDYTRIEIRNDNVLLNIDIDVTEDEYIPGELARVNLKCTDQFGAPVIANLSLSAVDEALLALSRDTTNELPSDFENSLHRRYDRYVGHTLNKLGVIDNATFYFYYYDSYYKGSRTYLRSSSSYAARAITRLGFPPTYADIKGPYTDVFSGLSGTDKLDPFFYRHLSLFELGGKVYGGTILMPMVTRTEVSESKGGEDIMTFEEYVPDIEEKGIIKGRDRLIAYLSAKETNEYLGSVLAKPGEKTETVQVEGEQFMQAHIRAYFSDSAYWKPDIYTDETGSATVTVDLPDNLTMWRFMSLGVDKGQRIGWNFDRCNVSKDVLVRIKAPRYMVAGDTARIKAIAHNYTFQERDFAISLDADRLYRSADDKDKVITKIEPGFTYSFENDMYAASPGRTRFVATALSNVESDATTKSINILPHGVYLRQAFCGRLSDSVGHELTLLGDIDPDTFVSGMTVVPSLSKVLSYGLDYYEDYPYNCVEQTLNRFLVNALLAGAAAELDLDETSLSKGLAEKIEYGIFHMEGQQNEDGGWPWWRGGKTSAYITAYAVDGLSALRGSPYVSELAAVKLDNMLQSGSRYLKGYIRGSRPGGYGYYSELSLYIVDVALRRDIMSPSSESAVKVFNSYFEDKDPMSPRRLVLLGSVAHYLGDEEKLGVILRNLDNTKHTGPNETVYWGTDPENCWYWWNDNVETTAKVLDLKLLVEPKSDHITGMVNWLVDERRGGAWKSTKDSAEATKALMKYIIGSPAASRSIKVDYDLNNKSGAVDLDPREYENPDELVSFDIGDFKTGKNEFKLERKKGKGPVFYSILTEYYTEAEEIPAIPGSVSIDREYYKIKTRKTGDGYVEERVPLKGPVKIGEEVEVELTINSPNAFDFVMIEDPRPAGLVFTEVKSGYDYYIDAYVELKTEKRAIMVEQLDKGENKFRYRLIAEVAGDFAALPATVKGMYSPDIGGSTASERITVVE
ncbi:MAG: hypothetical protein GY771_08990, partial [bacterium]|nr:hypothetical protein [bacterium]